MQKVTFNELTPAEQEAYLLAAQMLLDATAGDAEPDDQVSSPCSSSDQLR